VHIDTKVSKIKLLNFYQILEFSLVATFPLCLIYANEEEGTVSQNTTVIFGGGAFYLG
jgi:hypothetical protein